MSDIKNFKTALKENPRDVDAHYKLGFEYKKLKYFQQAIQHFKEAIRLQANPAVYFSLGSLYLDLRRHDLAIENFSHILKISPNSADAYNGLGEANVGLKNFDEAVKMFSKAAELAPKNSDFHFNLGRAYQRMQQHGEAMASLKQSIQANPENGSAYFYLGFAYCQVNWHAEAIPEFRKCIKLQPGSAEAYGNLGYAYSKLEKYDEAVKSYKQALKINPRLADVYKNLDEIYALQKNKTSAQTVAKESPADLPLLSFKGLGKVAGMNSLKQLLFHEVIRPMRDPALYKRFRLSAPNGVLLYGPPGCGKTYIAKQLSEELGWNFHEVMASSIGSVYIHGTVLAIRDIFKEAAEKAPSLLFIDEFEGLVPKRGELTGQQQHKAEEVTEFLVHLNECSAKKIFVIAATNEPEKIDEAIRRPGRLDKMIFVGPPDLDAREQALQMYFKDRPVEKIDVKKFARALEGYPFSDINHIADESARMALKEGKLFISNDHVAQAIRRNPSSLTPASLARFKNFQQRGI